MKTSKTRKRIVASLLVISVAIAPAAAYSGWVDDWVSQKSETSPSYFEGQKRGYFNGGSFSARWNLQNDYLMTIASPKLKTGCGGIDAFLGGFSFMNSDYLVTKLQRILSAAPAAAFDIALKTLAPQVSETISKFEAIVDKLNNIQLDECKSARAMVATIASPFAPANKQGELGAIQGEWWQSSGVGDLWSQFQKERKADNGKASPDAAVGSMSGCSMEFKSVFGAGSVLDNAAAKIGLASDYANMIRGFVGDIYIQPPDPSKNINAYTVAYDKPCDNDGFKSFLDGTAQSKPSQGSCTPSTDTNRNLVQYVTIKMVSISNKLKNKQALSDDETAFINANPLSVGLVIKAGVAGKQEGQLIATVADATAKAYAFNMLSDLYVKALSILETAKSVIASQSTATDGNAPHTCQIENVQDAVNNVETMSKKVYELAMAARTEYAAATTELATVLGVVDKMKNFNDQVYQALLTKFGRGVARRATGQG